MFLVWLSTLRTVGVARAHSKQHSTPRQNLPGMPQESQEPEVKPHTLGVQIFMSRIW